MALMRLSYNELIVFLLFMCIWFAHVSVKKIAYYRKVLIGIMWTAILMFWVRQFGILMDENLIPSNDSMLALERGAHHILTITIYSLYAFSLYCIVDHFHYYAKWKKLLLFVPCIVMDVLIITSQWTHLIYHVEDGVYYQDTLFFLVILVRDLYGIAATVRALQKRHLLPQIFGKCISGMALFSLIQLGVFLLTQDESLYYSTLIVNIIVFQMTITVVEFYKDNLTGLLNLNAFEEYVQGKIGRKSNKAVYLVKLKNYEYLKENCHDMLLNEMIVQIAECLKEYTMISASYYLGSGRFSIIVCKRDKFSEKDFLRKLEDRFSIPFDLNGARIQLNLFIAIMNLENGKIKKDNFCRYFKACDEMRYKSDEHIEIIHGDHFGIDQLQRYRNVEEAIERALVEKEFKMYYQPIVDAQKKKVVSAEALIRLNDRILGFVSPEEFIPISENNGKILEISEVVIDNVFRFVKENNLQEYGMEFIEMNLSVMQCMDKNLVDKLKFYIDKYNVNPEQINLEITETATNFDEKRLKEQLMKIKKLGFSFSLDDYGTGYSNLVRVLEYPVDMIKLDKSIVWSAFHDKDNFVTLKNLISMFHDVRRKLVAEGVESEDQMKALVELNCDYLQGYYYSKPVNEEEFVRFVNKYNQSNC